MRFGAAVFLAVVCVAGAPAAAGAATYRWHQENVRFGDNLTAMYSLSGEGCKGFIAGTFKQITVTLDTVALNFRVVISGGTYSFVTSMSGSGCPAKFPEPPPLPDVDVTFPVSQHGTEYAFGVPPTTAPLCHGVFSGDQHCFPAGGLLVGFGVAAFLGTSPRLVWDAHSGRDGQVITFVRDQLPPPFSHIWGTRFDIRLPELIAPPTVIDSVELTQAIQEWQSLSALKAELDRDRDGDGRPDREPPVPIVAGKPATLRVYLEPLTRLTSGTIEVAGAINGARSVSLDQYCTVHRQRRQIHGCNSIDFIFQPPAGDFEITIRLKNASGSVLETHVLPFRSRTLKALRLHAVSVCNAGEQTIRPSGCAPADALKSHVGFLRKIIPTSVMVDVYQGKPVTVDWGKHALEYDWWFEVHLLLTGVWRKAGGIASTAGTVEKFYGMVAEPPAPYAKPTIRGVGAGVAGTSLVATSYFGVDQTADVVAHEVGHTLGLQHTNTAIPMARGGSPPGCILADDPTTYWPLLWDNRIRSRLEDDGIEVGFDVAHSFSDAGTFRGRALAGETTFDLMGYCEPSWISPLNYNRLITALGSASTSDASTTEAPRQVGPGILVSGTIEDGVVQFQPLFAIDAEVEAGTGPFSVQLRDASETALSSTRFTPFTAETTDTRRRGFSLVVPRVPTAASLVMLSEAGEVVARLPLGGAAPSVQLQSPRPPDTLAGERLLTWTVSDPDTSNHTIVVQYSPDSGVTWVEVGTFETTQAWVDFDALPGGPATLIRLMVSDGVNSSTSTFGPFTTPKKRAVTAAIVSPAADAVVAPGLVFFDGFALDPDDGSLTGTSLAWRSDLAGALGTGEQIAVSLGPGRHVIELKATDSDGNSATTTVTVVVAGPAPQVAMTIHSLNTAVTCVAATIGVTAAGLPAAGAEYSLDAGETWFEVPVAALPFRFIVPGSGAFNMIARAFDAAGQATVARQQFTTTGTCAAVAPAAWAAPAAGGTQTVSLSSAVTNLAWTAFTDRPWLTVSRASGTGAGTVTLTAAATTSAATRTATAWIAGQAVAVTQAAGTPTFTISPASWSAPNAGATQTIAVTTAFPDAPWTAASSAAWLTVSPAGGVGSGSVTLTAAANPGGTTRTATAPIAGQTLSVSQGTAVPFDLRVVRVDGNLVTLRWSWNGPPVPGFVVAGGMQRGQTLATLPTGSGSPIYTFTAPTGSFFVRVHAADDAALERPSNEVPLVVNLPVTPSPPANLLATIDGNRVDLAWTNTFGGGPPAGVTLQVTGAVTGSFPLGLTERFSFSGVPAGTYTLALVAANGGGVSGPSNALTLTFPRTCTGPPLPPARFLAYRLGRTAFVVFEPAETGPAPTGFTIHVAELGLNLPTGGARSASGSVGPGTYTLSVQATNACGASAFTPAQALVVP